MSAVPKRRLRWRLWLALAVLAVAGVWLIVRYGSAETPPPATTIVRRGDLENAVLATGTLRPRMLVAVGAQATGRILSLKVQPGQTVRAGDTVALIDATNQQNELDKARATLRQNEAARDQTVAELALARQDLERHTLMIGRNTVARADYDRAVAAVKVRQAQLASNEAVIAAARIEVRIAEANLAYTRITAPADGTVLATLVQEGQTVNAQQSAPTIAILGALDTMTVEVNVSEADILQVHAGMPLYFTVSGTDSRRYDGKLDQIEPAPDKILSDRSFGHPSSAPGLTASAIYYKGVFSVPNPDGLLRTYMTADVHIVLATARDVLLVPVSALRAADRPDRATVRVLDATGRPVERTVETGISDRIDTEIRAGLQEGDRVVTDNQDAPPAPDGA